MKTFLFLVAFALVLTQCNGLTCYACQNFNPSDCGDSSYDGETIEDDEGLCFVSIFPSLHVVRGITTEPGKVDGQCDKYEDGDNFIGLCYCAGDKCNTGACEHCT
ncbi:unnamed protein product [Meganyctiphanes norvegica]|uniref:Protein sleepless n=1 Tax=Meganyctiphanes norvegica TaxID=48144 RepID=A0AAV2RE48_MEGNR